MINPVTGFMLMLLELWHLSICLQLFVYEDGHHPGTS